MKKWIPFLWLSLVFVACNEGEIDYKSEIQGKWICNEINYLYFPSEEIFILDFLNDNRQCYGQVYNSLEGATWMEGDDYTYSVDGEMLSIKGTNPLGQSLELSMKIKRVGPDYLDYQETKTMIDGNENCAHRIFSFYKANDLPTETFTGMWELYTLELNDSLSTSNYKFDFKSDQTFELYHQTSDTWNRVEGLTNTYYIHGNLLVLNFSRYGDDTESHTCRIFTVRSSSAEKINCSSLKPIAGGNNLLEQKYTFERR